MLDRDHLRLVLAARKSTKTRDASGREIDAIGIETQDKRGRAWAERQGHVIVAVAPDVKSGTVAPWDRPKLRPWVTDPALMSQIDGVLAYRNDRLSRGCWADEARIRLWAEEHGKVLVIVDGPQWPPRHDGDEWSWEAMSKQARREWEEIRERSMRAQAELRDRGKLVGRPPFGYASAGTKYDHTIVPTDEGRRLVPQMFQRVIDEQSLATIAAWLATETGRPWWPRTVGALIRNPTYMGRRCAQDPKTRAYGRTLLRCEQLVDAATFKRAGKALDGRPKRGPVNPETRAPLSGVLSCPRCADSPMYRVMTGRGASRTAYYRCTGRGAERRSCGNMVRAALVDTAVDRAIATYFDKPVMAHTVIPGNEAELAARAEDIQFEIRQLGTLDLDDETYDRQLAALRAERDQIKAAEVVPDRVQLADTGRRYAQEWAGIPVPERGPWLARHGFRVTASKTLVTVAQGTTVVEVPL
jgi:DNA invertase Pin-like site-specific DNA recombinase